MGKLKTLVVDQGNSLVKWAVFENRKLIEKDRIPESDLSTLQKAKEKHSVSHIIYSSSGNRNSLRLDLPTIAFSWETPLPIKLSYGTPETLGLDRIANAVGAASIFPGENCLAIDLGTCITYDLIDDKGFYRGGAISPGAMMRLKSMNNFTARLPLVTMSRVEHPLGTSTVKSLQSGVFFGIKGEIDGFISSFKMEFPGLKVMLTGGDALYFEKELKSNIFADFDLTLKGLNEILIYNIRKTGSFTGLDS